jgi:hypothetical protein
MCRPHNFVDSVARPSSSPTHSRVGVLGSITHRTCGWWASWPNDDELALVVDLGGCVGWDVGVGESSVSWCGVVWCGVVWCGAMAARQAKQTRKKSSLWQHHSPCVDVMDQGQRRERGLSNAHSIAATWSVRCAGIHSQGGTAHREPVTVM